MDLTTWFIAIFFGILFLLALVHLQVNKSFKIESSWVAVALAPAVIWLVLSGQLTELTFLGVNFKVREASSKSFSLRDEGMKLRPEAISTGQKGGSNLIDDFQKRGTEALLFEVGFPGYVNRVIMDYFEGVPSLRYVVFVDKNDKFRALASAAVVYAEMKNHQLDLAGLIQSDNLSGITGLLTEAISESASKGDALRLMEVKGSAELPVVDENGMFIGILDRDKLTSSIVADLITRQLADR